MPLSFKLFERNKRIFLYVKATGDMIDSDVDEYKQYFTKLFNKKVKFRCIYDVAEMNCPSMSYIYKIAQFINDTRDQSKGLNIESLVYVENYLVKNLINILFTIAPPVSPCRITDDKKEISKFCS